MPERDDQPEVGLPDDDALPALRVIADRGFESVLDEVGLGGPIADVELVKHFLGVRCVFRVDRGGHRLLVKIFSTDPSPLIALFEALDREGLATGVGPTAAPLVAFDRPLRLVVTDWLAGPAARDLILEGRGRRAGELAATWLRASSRTAIDLGAPYGSAEQLEDATRWAADVACADAALGTQAEDCVEALAARQPRSLGFGLCHGDFTANHVLDLGGGPGVID